MICKTCGLPKRLCICSFLKNKENIKKLLQSLFGKYKDDFHYCVDGQAQVVLAGERQTHESRFPIKIAFDRGDGSEPAEVTLPNGTYRVGISSETNLRDLFYVGPAGEPVTP